MIGDADAEDRLDRSDVEGRGPRPGEVVADGHACLGPGVGVVQVGDPRGHGARRHGGSARGCRAERPEDEEAIRKIVLSTIEVAQKQGQLDETQLTLRDLSIITDVFVNILRGTHHPRISYPKESPATQDVSTYPNKK